MTALDARSLNDFRIVRRYIFVLVLMLGILSDLVSIVLGLPPQAADLVTFSYETRSVAWPRQFEGGLTPSIRPRTF
jgi:hypothetical protein